MENLTTLYTEEIIYHISENKINATSLANAEVVIICKKEDASPEYRKKLDDILKAVNWEDGRNCSVITLEQNQRIDFGSLSKSFPLVISFGIEEKELSIQAIAPYYEHLKFEDTILVRSHTIAEIMSNKSYKVQLWNSIKVFKKE